MVQGHATIGIVRKKQMGCWSLGRIDNWSISIIPLDSFFLRKCPISSYGRINKNNKGKSFVAKGNVSNPVGYTARLEGDSLEIVRKTDGWIHGIAWLVRYGLVMRVLMTMVCSACSWFAIVPLETIPFLSEWIATARSLRIEEWERFRHSLIVPRMSNSNSNPDPTFQPFLYQTSLAIASKTWQYSYLRWPTYPFAVRLDPFEPLLGHSAVVMIVVVAAVFG